MLEARGGVALGFDFGLKRIGIASGDTISATAAPRATASVTACGPDWTLIERLLGEYRPAVLIVGSPRHADGSASALSAATDRFAAELARRSGLPVRRADEYASSIEAADALRGARARGTHRRRLTHADIDGAAAAIILERWLKARQNGTRTDTLDGNPNGPDTDST
jgi:putative holliday junction resolvase